MQLNTEKKIFKQAMTHLRFSTSMSSPKIASESIKTLALLLSRSLASQRSPKDSNFKEDPKKVLVLDTRERENEELQSSSDSPQVAYTQLATAVSSLTTGTTRVIAEDITNDNISFARNMNERLPTPLLALLNLIPSHKSAKVREVGAELCKCILIDTYSFWYKDNALDVLGSETIRNEGQHQDISKGNDLIDGALECLFTMIGGDEGKYSNIYLEILVR